MLTPQKSGYLLKFFINLNLNIMPIINPVKPEEATGRLAEIYKQFQEMMGFIPTDYLSS